MTKQEAAIISAHRKLIWDVDALRKSYKEMIMSYPTPEEAIRTLFGCIPKPDLLNIRNDQ